MNIAKFIPKPLKLSIKHLLQRRSLHMSQAGQDFWIYAEAFNEKKKGYFLDIGAHDGINLSNTYLLEYRYDWNGICVEANPDTFRQLKKNRRAICENLCLDSAEGFVDFAIRDTMGGIISPDTDNYSASKSCDVIRIKTKTLNCLMKEKEAPHEIDYLSIDVEGAEERILGIFNFKEYQFKCITIERPTDALRKIFMENQYTLVKEIPSLDCLYVHKNFLSQYWINLFGFYKKKYLTIRWK